LGQTKRTNQRASFLATHNKENKEKRFLTDNALLSERSSSENKEKQEPRGWRKAKQSDTTRDQKEGIKAKLAMSYSFLLYFGSENGDRFIFRTKH
jgi:hypothetical protein